MRVYVCDEFLWELSVEVRPRQACGFRCMLFLREQVRDLRVQEFLSEIVVGVMAPSDLAGSFLVKILYSIKGGAIEQGCSNFEIILPYLRLLISLSLSLVFVYLACLYCLYLYMLYILMLN